MGYTSQGGNSPVRSAGYSSQQGGGAASVDKEAAKADRGRKAQAGDLARLKQLDPGAYIAAYKKYGADIPIGLLRERGINVDDISKPGGNHNQIEDKVANGIKSLGRASGSSALRVLDIIGRGGQAVLSAGHEGALAKGTGVGNQLKRIAGGFGKGIEGKTNLDVAGALGVQAPTGSSKYLFHAANLIGGATSDPTIVLGGGSAAKSGLSAVKAAFGETGETVAKNIAKTGLKDVAEQATVRAKLGQHLLQNPTPKLNKLLDKKGEKAFADAVLKKADKITGELTKGGQTGLKIGGHTVVPTADNEILRGVSALKGSSIGQRAATSERLIKIHDAFNTYGDATRMHGKEVSQDIKQVVTGGTASGLHGGAEAIKGIEQVIKDTKVTPADLNVIGHAIDTGADLTALPDNLRVAAEKLKGLNEELDSALKSGGLHNVQDASLFNPETPLHQFLTPEGRKFIDKHGSELRAQLIQAGKLSPNAPEDLITALDQAGHLRGTAQAGERNLGSAVQFEGNQGRLFGDEQLRDPRATPHETFTGRPAADSIQDPLFGTKAPTERGPVSLRPGFNSNDQLKSAMGGVSLGGAKSPYFSSGKSLQTAEDTLRQFLPDSSKVPKFFETNAAKITARRAEQVHGALAKGEVLDNLTRLKTADGHAFAITAEGLSKAESDALNATKTLRGVAYEPVRVGDKLTYVRKEIAKEVQGVEDALSSDKSIRAIQQTFDHAQTIWKSLETVPLIGLGFHARNAEGNLWLNYLAGMGPRQVKFYGQAAKIQALDALGKTLTRADAEALLKGFRTGAVDTGLFGNDLRTAETSLSRKLAGHEDILHQILPFVRRQGTLSGLAVGSGRKVGSAVENNARLAHFLWKLDQGATEAEAAKSVKTFLFDYADLTPFEQKYAKRVVPFYTFMRKNLPVQLKHIVTEPGKFSAIGDVRRAYTGGQAAPQGEIPGYATAGGAVATHGLLKRLLSPGAKGDIYGGVDLPFFNVNTPLDPARKIAADVAATAQGKRQPYALKEVATDLINVPGGGLTEGVKLLIERSTGKRLQTGAPVKGSAWADAAKIVFPLYDKAIRAKDKVKASRYADLLLGIKTTEIGDKQKVNESLKRMDELKGLVNSKRLDEKALKKLGLWSAELEKAKQDGTFTGYTPKLSDLQKAGRIPTPTTGSGGKSTGGYQSQR